MISSAIADKVVTVGPDPSGKGGIASVVQYYRDELFPRWHFIAEARATGGKLSKLCDAVSSCVRLVSLLKTNPEIRIVHLHTAGKISFPRSCIYMRLAKLMGRKVVMHMHSGTFPTYCKGKEKRVGKELSQADAVIVLGDAWLRYYGDTFGLTDLHVVPNIVPDACEGFDISEREDCDRVHALFLGQLVDTKGIYDLLEGLAAVRNDLDGRFMLHVGGKGDTGRFLSEVRRLGLENIVTYEGWISADRKIELLRKSSISILPSYFEGLPISLLEGMAYGHSVISTDVGSIPEIVDGSNGVIVTPGDIAAISEAVTTLVNDRDRLRLMGEVSLTKVKPYLPDSVAKSLEDVYTNLLDK